MSAGEAAALMYPLPWKWEEHELSEGYSCIIYDAYGRGIPRLDHLDRATADLIVRSANAHDDFVDALKDALAGLQYIRQHHGNLYGVGFDRVEGKAKAALAKAEGR